MPLLMLPMLPMLPLLPILPMLPMRLMLPTQTLASELAAAIQAEQLFPLVYVPLSVMSVW
jgi:hypothetical protein